MGEMISSLGQWLSSNNNGLKTLQGLSTGTGEVGNVLNMIQRGQQYDKLKAFENLSPQALAAKVAAGTQPLNKNLVQGVTNAVQGADAERGLVTSPGIFSSDLGQALAPYQAHNQDQAMQLLFQQMGLPVKASSILNPTVDLSKSLADLFKGFQTSSSPAPNPFPSLAQAAINSANLTPTNPPLPGLSDWSGS